MPAPGAERRSGWLLRHGVQLAVLSALALAQPVFDILGRNPTFFAVRGSSSRDIVLFALALTLLPPAALLTIELAAAAVSRTLADVLHTVFVGGFVALLALSVLTKGDSPTGAAAVALAVAVGAVAAFAFVRTAFVRSLLMVLAPVPLLFLGLFLLHSPVRRLVFVDTPQVRAATVTSRTSVVLILFDEFSTVGLMDARQRIDATRYPNFAKLADEGTWYRNATTRSWVSEVSVPSILTGRAPAPGKLPVFAEYPNNLFTLLGKAYRVRSIESLTRLCPPKICRDQPQQAARAASPKFGSLTSDVGIVYLHLLLPKPYVDRVPSIDDSWGDFGQAEEADAQARPGVSACGRNICNFVDLIEPGPRPTLYVLDSLLPHTPYVYLPTTQRYVVDPRLLRGLDGGGWGADPWPVLQGYQRYLLQVGYTDRALGLIMDRLRATGLYDRSLVIVSADHGVSFHARGRRRLPTPDNLDDIAFVPLFVKLPRQRRGRIDDSFARTTDILPTIAKVLGVRLPWRSEGRPLLGRLPRAGRVSVVTNVRNVELELSTLRARRTRSLARQVAAFGEGPWARLYRVGPHRELVGQAVAALPVRPSESTRITLDSIALLQAVDPDSSFMPSFVEGKLTGKFVPRQDLAVAVNGTVAAVTRTFTQNGETRFSAFVPETALREGRNDVGVFGVRGRAPGLTLDQFPIEELSLTLGQSRGREVIRTSQGKTIRVTPAAITGSIRVTPTATGYEFAGSATVARPRRRADAIVVFVDGHSVYRGRAGGLRPQAILGQREFGKFGFAFDLPHGLLPPPGRGHSVRVYAIRGAVASRLREKGAVPWSG